MADVAKLMEEIKSMTVIELSNFVKALEEEFGVSAAAPVALKKRPSSTLSSKRSAQTKSRLSKQFAKLPVLALSRQNRLSKPLPRPSKKAFPKTPQKLSLQNSKRPAQLRNSNNQTFLKKQYTRGYSAGFCFIHPYMDFIIVIL